MSALLETRNLGKKFGEVIAAAHLNITIQPGEIVGLIGSNGAGKTTFVNMVTGYTPASEGEIFFHQENIGHLTPKELARKGMCRSFQIPQLFLDLTAIDNIIIALLIAQQKKLALLQAAMTPELADQAIYFLERFKISQYANEKVSTLAQGVRKLIDIAMATAGKPQLLFLDEPTSGVSADEKMPIMEVLMEALQDKSTSILFIEHDMEIIEHFAPRTLAFYEGQVLADGDTQSVFSDDKVQAYVIGRQAIGQQAATDNEAPRYA